MKITTTLRSNLTIIGYILLPIVFIAAIYFGWQEEEKVRITTNLLQPSDFSYHIDGWTEYEEEGVAGKTHTQKAYWSYNLHLIPITQQETSTMTCTEALAYTLFQPNSCKPTVYSLAALLAKDGKTYLGSFVWEADKPQALQEYLDKVTAAGYEIKAGQFFKSKQEDLYTAYRSDPEIGTMYEDTIKAHKYWLQAAYDREGITPAFP